MANEIHDILKKNEKQYGDLEIVADALEKVNNILTDLPQYKELSNTNKYNILGISRHLVRSICGDKSDNSNAKGLLGYVQLFVDNFVKK